MRHRATLVSMTAPTTPSRQADRFVAMLADVPRISHRARAMALRISLSRSCSEMRLAAGMFVDLASVLDASSGLPCVVARLCEGARVAGEDSVLPWNLAARIGGGRAALHAFALRLAASPASRRACTSLVAGPEHASLGRTARVSFADASKRVASDELSLRFVKSEVTAAGLIPAATDNTLLHASLPDSVMLPELPIAEFVRSAEVALCLRADTLRAGHQELRRVFTRLLCAGSATATILSDPVSEAGASPMHDPTLADSAVDGIVSGLYDFVSAVRKAHAAYPAIFVDGADAATVVSGHTAAGGDLRSPAQTPLATRRTFPVVVTASSMARFR